MKTCLVIIVFASAFAQAQTDPLIEMARKAAAVYAQSLPDYVVKRATSRYRKSVAVQDSTIPSAKTAPHLDVTAEAPGWQLADVITGDVAVQQGREVYTNIRVNGKSANYLPPGGSWSAGEFAGEIPMVFSADSGAVFSHPHAESVRGHATIRYDFAVDQQHSKWNMAAANTGYGQSNVDYSPAYTGRVWIEKQTGETLAVEMSVHGLPPGFPVATVDSHTDYDYENIGGAKFVLPVHSETTSCEPGGNVCLKNETGFKDFKKFESSSNVTFDQAH